MSNKPQILPYIVPQESEEDIEAREERDVHSVYEAIAPHFSSTRYKAWPIITSFLTSLPPNSLGLDSGAGNGKYLPILAAQNPSCQMIALDRSIGLLSIAQKQGRQGGEECLRADLRFDGFRAGVFDFIISVAALHHLSTPLRRLLSLRALLRSLHYPSSPTPGSRFLVYCWAFEQSSFSKRAMGTAQSTGEEGVEVEESEKVQDVLVPWVLLPPQPAKVKKPSPRRGEVKAAAAARLAAGEPELTPVEKEKEGKEEEAKVFHRYYHLFVKGELRELILEAGRGEGLEIRGEGGLGEEEGREGGEEGARRWLRIRGEGWEKDNWWVEGEVGC